MEKLSEILPEKLAENQIEATCVAMAAHDQVRFECWARWPISSPALAL